MGGGGGLLPHIWRSCDNTATIYFCCNVILCITTQKVAQYKCAEIVPPPPHPHPIMP